MTAWPAVFSPLLGCGIASVNTYLALYGVRRLGLGPTAGGALVAVLGVAGIAGRVGWSRVAGRPGRVAAGLSGRRCGGAALLLAASRYAHPPAWVAAVAVGVFAVAANAVSMVLVMQRAAPGRAGQDSALVSAGFFAGVPAPDQDLSAGPAVQDQHGADRRGLARPVGAGQRHPLARRDVEVHPVYGRDTAVPADDVAHPYVQPVHPTSCWSPDSSRTGSPTGSRRVDSPAGARIGRARQAAATPSSSRQRRRRSRPRRVWLLTVPSGQPVTWAICAWVRSS